MREMRTPAASCLRGLLSACRTGLTQERIGRLPAWFRGWRTGRSLARGRSSGFSVRLVVALLALPLLQSAAFASSITLNAFSASPSAIDTGSTATWTLGLTLNATHPGEQFSSANLTFGSGDGRTTVFSGSWQPQDLATYGWVDHWVSVPVGSSCSYSRCSTVYSDVNEPYWGVTGHVPSTAAASASFDYGLAGTYFGSVSGTVTASWQQSDPVYGWVDDWWRVVVGEDCAPFVGCRPVYDYVNYPVWGVTGSQVNTYTESFEIDGSVPGQLATSWEQLDPVYGWVDNWWREAVSEDCAPFLGCRPVYAYVNSPYWGVTGSQLNTHTQSLPVDALTVARGSSVPEPASYALVGLALAGLVVSRRKAIKQSPLPSFLRVTG